MPGEASVQVIRGCGTPSEERSPVTSASVTVVSPAFFNFINNLDGSNSVAASRNGLPTFVSNPSLFPGAESQFAPAERGEFVSFWATGFGATNPPLAAGEISMIALAAEGGLAPLTNELSITIGGIAVPPEDIRFYAGAAPCCAGLYQFVVRIPPNAPDGDLPVEATIM